MEDLKKVRLMANLAIYDKHFGEEDRKITSLYKRDYIYMKNLSMRMGLVLGLVVIIGFYYSYKIFIADANIFELFTKAEFIRIGVYSIIALVAYSMVGMLIYGKRYDLAEDRTKRYEKMLSRLYEDETKPSGKRPKESGVNQ